MKAQDLYRRWKRRGSRLLEDLGSLLDACRQEGAAEQVHEMRVTLRRLRLCVRVARPLLDPAAVVQLKEWARRVSDATSGVRDLDAAIEWLSIEAPKGKAIAEMRLDRERSWERCRGRLEPFPDGLAERLVELKGGPKKAGDLRKRFAKLLKRLETIAAHQMPAFFELDNAGQHQYRRTLRWWRYLRELALSKKDIPKDRLLKELIALQGSIGEHQNHTITIACVGKLIPDDESTALVGLLEKQQASLRADTREGFVRLCRLRGWRAAKAAV